MDDQELSALLLDLESDRVERKRSLSEPDRICEAICAFANDLPNQGRPGIIFVGVEDDGRCANLPITDELLRKLADMRQNGNITPFPSLVVQKRRLADCDLAVVIVQPSDSPPFRFRGRTWIRVGPRRAVATVEEERRLSEKRRYKNQAFELQPCRSATIEDLDLVLFNRVYLPACVAPEILAANERSTDDQLRALGLLDLNLAECPTNLGILVVGSQPTHFLPGAYVQFIRFDGIDLDDPIKDQAAIGGPLPDLFRWLDGKLVANVSVATQIVGTELEIRRPDYPVAALHQLTRNAVLHRTYEGTNAPVRVIWYSDRIEIQSPGGPYGAVRRENFGVRGMQDYRNPSLAAAMRNLGLIQRFGIGIHLARQELKKNSNPPLEFEIDESFVRAIVRRRPATE